MNTNSNTTTTVTTTYYVVETRYCGANPFENADFSRYEIRTAPFHRIGGDGGPCTDGWCGSWNESSYYGHGDFDSIDEAVDAVKDLCGGEYRDVENEYDDDGIVATYKPGRLAPMSRRNLADYVAASFKAVDASTSDEAILEISAELLDEAESNGYTFEPVTLIEWLAEHRESLEE